MQGDLEICNNRDKIVLFLKTLTTSLENNELSQSQLKHLGKFQMSYMFLEQAEKDIKEEQLYSKDDIVKFISLGWYVYTSLLNNESLPTMEDLD